MKAVARNCGGLHFGSAWAAPAHAKTGRHG